MAISGLVVTVEEIMATRPGMRLKLAKEAKSLADMKPDESELIPKVKGKVVALFQRTEAHLNLEELAKKEDYEKEVDATFDEMVSDVQEARKKFKDVYDSLHPDDRNKLMKYLKAVGKFLNDVLDWLSNMFKYVVEKIRKNFKIVKDAFSGVFKTIYEFLKEIF